jgi:thymidylate synthase
MHSDFAFVSLHGRDLDDMWFMLLDNLHRFGREYHITEGSYAGQKRLTFDFVAGFIDFPHTRPLAPSVPESSSLPPPTTDHEIEQYFANYLMNSELAPNEDYRYATWIVGGKYQLPKAELFIVDEPKNQEFVWEDAPYIKVPNQIQWIIDHFNSKGYGNEHCYLTVGYPESNFAYDVPYNDETERRTSPCLRGLDFRIVNNRLLTHVIYRSWDLVGGWPTNMGGFALLNQYVADNLEGVEPGPLAFSCKSLHAYDHSYEYVKARTNRT